jgi:acetolactate synthase-1/2/3 large subunit
MPETHRNSAGFIGSYGRTYSNELAKKADVLLAVGTRFEEEETSLWLSEYVFQIPPTKLIQIDIEPREIGKNYPVEAGIVGDAKSTLSQLIASLKGKRILSGPARIDELQKYKKAWFEKILPLMTSDEVPLNPRRVLKELEECVTEDMILVIDPSWSRLGLLQQFPLPCADRAFVVSGMLPIGWSTAAALGMALAKSKSKIVAIQGDGGFLLNIQSVATAVEYDLPITWIVLNNYAYNALAVLQRAYFGKRTTGSDFIIKSTGELYSPDYAVIAKACGADGERIERPEEIKPALKRGLKSTKPYVLDFVISKWQSRLPRTAQVSWDYFWSRDRE